MRAVAGTVLGSRYELTDPIASGGMGEVWQAHDELLGRTVAVKVLREELVCEPGFLARFRTEARNTARLAHANIATTYDYGESDGSAWLVMELVPGEPLSDLLAREGALEPRRAMRLLAKAAAGLAAAHAAGIVHRDVKPGNLLVTPDGGVKVTDFGIARAAAEAPLTATGQVMGTAAYLAPEQATGRRDLTPAVDVYALGVVAHEMLAGERPFTGESQVAIALAQVNDPPPPLPRWVPGAARELVALCLAKDRLDRPAQAGVVAEVAGRIADGDDAGAMTVLENAHGGYRHDPQGGLRAGGIDPTVVALPPTNVMPPGAAAAGGAGAGGLAGSGFAPTGQQYAGQQYAGQQYAGQEGAAGPYTGQNAPHLSQSGQFTGQGGQYPGAGGHSASQGPAQPPPEPRRRRLTAPLLGLVAVLLVVLAVLLFNQFSGAGTAGTGSGSTPSPTTPAVPTPTTPSPSPTSSSPTPSSPSTTPTTDTPSPSPTTPTPSSTSPSASPSTTPEPSATTPSPSATTPSASATTSAAPTPSATG